MIKYRNIIPDQRPCSLSRDIGNIGIANCRNSCNSGFRAEIVYRIKNLKNFRPGAIRGNPCQIELNGVFTGDLLSILKRRVGIGESQESAGADPMSIKCGVDVCEIRRAVSQIAVVIICNQHLQEPFTKCYAGTGIVGSAISGKVETTRSLFPIPDFAADPKRLHR